MDINVRYVYVCRKNPQQRKRQGFLCFCKRAWPAHWLLRVIVRAIQETARGHTEGMARSSDKQKLHPTMSGLCKYMETAQYGRVTGARCA